MAQKSELTRARLRSAWIFLAPMLIVLAAIAAWPLLRTIYFSFTDAKLGDDTSTFIWFDNYLTWYRDDSGVLQWDGLLVTPLWWRAVFNTLWFAAISVAVETVFGIVVALVLNATFPGRALVRAAVLIPWAIPTIVSAKMWSWMLNDEFGVINDLLMRLHIISAPVAWTANGSTAMWAVIMVDVWKTTSFMSLLILAAMQMLPSDCYEAAKVDGINPVTVFFKVTLPLIWPAVMVAVIFRALDALRIFDLIYVLTSGSKDTMSLSSYAQHELISYEHVGVGSAAATLLFIIISILTVIALTVGKVRLGEEVAR